MRQFLRTTLLLRMLFVILTSQSVEGQGADAAAPSATGKTTSLISDASFEQGFTVWSPKPGRKVPVGKLVPVSGRKQPAWGLAQWHSRFDLSEAKRESVATNVFRYSDGAKSVVFDFSAAGESVVTFGVDGAAEFNNTPPVRGSAWPHLLAEQELAAHPSLSELESIPFRISYRLIKQESDDTLPGWDGQRHTAQFLLYITLSNRNRDSTGYGDYLWFGVPMYDARHRHTSAHKTVDFSTKNKKGTGKFIFNPAGKRYTAQSAHDGEWITINHDLLPLMKEALYDAWNKGFLTDSRNLGDYRLGGINCGWEVTGTWNVAMQIKGLMLDATFRD